MLPPILSLSVVPVTSQQDPVRSRPEIPAVVPTQASSGDSTIDLKQHGADQAALLLREAAAPTAARAGGSSTGTR